MIIHSYMVPKVIVEVWENTADVFKEYNVPLSDKTLETLVEADTLTPLLQELNAVIGSSPETDCG